MASVDVPDAHIRRHRSSELAADGSGSRIDTHEGAFGTTGNGTSTCAARANSSRGAVSYVANFVARAFRGGRPMRARGRLAVGAAGPSAAVGRVATKNPVLRRSASAATDRRSKIAATLVLLAHTVVATDPMSANDWVFDTFRRPTPGSSRRLNVLRVTRTQIKKRRSPNTRGTAIVKGRKPMKASPAKRADYYGRPISSLS